MLRFHSMVCLLAVAAASLTGARAQGAATGFVLSDSRYSITFSQAWKVVYPPTFLGKNGGLDGLAYVGIEAGANLPDPDSVAAFYSIILGGHVKPGSAKDTVLGKYTVRRQAFTYDSLPRLDSMIQANSGLPIKHRNGEFRVYALTSDGYIFAVAGLAAFPGVPAPYADIERAISTLVLHAGAGVRFTRAAGAPVWMRDGRLGGEWLKAHPPLAIECFDARGALMGEAVSGGGGEWLLPALAPGYLTMRIRARDGSLLEVSSHLRN